MTLTERINAAAEDMSFDAGMETASGDHLMQFLSNHGLEIVDAKSERAAEADVVAAALALSSRARNLLFEQGDGTCQPFVEAVLALHSMPDAAEQTPMQKAGMEGTGSHAADLKALRAEQDQNTLLVAMLRNMVAAPVFWRSRAKALLSRIDGPEVPNPATPPASES